MPRSKGPQKPDPTTETAPVSVQTPAPGKSKAQPITVKKQDALSPEEKRRRERSIQDSYDVEESIWRSIYS